MSPGTASVVERWKNSGTISTMPPTAITSRISTIIRKLLVSIFSCVKPVVFFSGFVMAMLRIQAALGSAAPIVGMRSGT